MNLLESQQSPNWGSLLIESDAFYFELGACLAEGEGFSLAYAPGLTNLPAGCIVTRMQGNRLLEDPDAWITDVESTTTKCSARRARFYLNGCSPAVAQTLRSHGYRSRSEIGLFLTPRSMTVTRVRLHAVADESDWRRKMCIHRNADIGSDGYRYPGEAWTELIRRKWNTGRKQSYLIESQGKVVGTIGALQIGPLLRVKNVFVAPPYRRRGFASAALAILIHEAWQSGLTAIGLFAVPQSAGHALYTRCGFRPVVELVEWTKRLRPAA